MNTRQLIRAGFYVPICPVRSLHLPVGRVVGQLGQSGQQFVSAALDVARDAVARGAALGQLSALRMTITVWWRLLSATALTTTLNRHRQTAAGDVRRVHNTAYR